MPGKQVKDWKLYHRLIERGYSKESAARIANESAAAKRRRKPKRRTRQKRGVQR